MHFSLPAQEENSVQVTTENGIIEGFFDTESGLHHFFGIPFAQPPVGELRWKAPQPLKDWSGVKETKEFGPAPVQANVFGDMEFRSKEQSEDCLYLNVWTPSGENRKDLPVLVYFYGGGFVAGDASEPRYDGAAMAQRGIVVVTTNYRLNIFGFFAHPELSEEAPYNASGNYGLLDQNAALNWVQNNIEGFGGNPEKVTIAGESAGSISVSAQMASPLSKDLIAGAIGESGAAIEPTMAPVSLDEAEQNGLEFAEAAGYDSVEELRDLATREIFEIYTKSQRFGFPSVIDGYFFPKSLPEIYRAGEQAQVPLLLGWNSAEVPGMAFTQGPYSEDNYIEKVKEAYPEDNELVLQLYPPGSEKDIELSATALASDRFIAYSTWKWFDLHRKNSEQPVYRYLYSKIRPPLKDENLTSGLAGGTEEKAEEAPPQREPVGAPHAAEIEYFLGNLARNQNYSWTKDDYKVSETIQQYLANFIKSGNPNGENLPEWPSAQAADKNPPVLIMDVESRVEKAANEERYLFLDKSYGNDE
ncbi:carboxylic ester hydrolase [Salinimicrobium marinum]|uniref:Carboxylic ester hydrolase n=2 Tax=Salinimicrobium marinum TaxID=680283 RepID=A0A918SHX7_9FLAO|nr:carboxylic ester hydrolase [Salinimicrobium marinum]